MRKLMACLVALIAAGGVSATPVVLTFEGLQNFEPIGNFYNGGLGGNGSGPGPNFGVTFSGNALALIDSDAGGSGNFGGEPSPSTAAFFLTGGGALTMNVPGGFDTGFSFFYTAISQPGVIRVYDGLNGTGNLLATLNLPVTPSDGGDPTGTFSPFFPIGVTFSGIALSVDFGGVANQIAFDDITLGSATPGGVVPEPISMLVFGGLMVGGVGAALRRRMAKKVVA